MTQFAIHTSETAPEASRQGLVQTEHALGFVPNLLGTLAAAPSALNAYQRLSGLLDQSSLSATEVQLALLQVSVQNGCEYCVAAHTTLGGMKKVPQDAIEAVRNGTDIADPKLQAFRSFVRSVVVTKGHVPDDIRQDFFEAGYGPQQVLEVLVAASMKTISNYLGSFAPVRLDEAFQPAAWSERELQSAAE